MAYTNKKKRRAHYETLGGIIAEKGGMKPRPDAEGGVRD